MSLAGLDRFRPRELELDLASIIRIMEDDEEDMFVKEERWIMAGGDCLFSEFEQRTSVKISSNESWATFLSTIYKSVYKTGKK
jgi:hypothetical protein